ncbi:hypothetical protein GEMRC1_000634 [Eukaryota sp. GEM-RC1]
MSNLTSQLIDIIADRVYDRFLERLYETEEEEISNLREEEEIAEPPIPTSIIRPSLVVVNETEYEYLKAQEDRLCELEASNKRRANHSDEPANKKSLNYVSG